MECYLTVTYANYPFLDINNKEKPNRKRGELSEINVLRVSDLYVYFKKV